MTRTAARLWPRIINWENFLSALHLASKGKRERRASKIFHARLRENLSDLIDEVNRGRYEPGEYGKFIVHDPKRREIHAPAFRDRVLHHAILNQCEPVFERVLINDTYACRKFKGQHRAVERALENAGNRTFFLKLDIRRYFDSIVHENVERLLRRLFRERALLDLFHRIIRSYATSPGRGVPIGALTSQFIANHYLSPLDRHVTESLSFRAYVRYMDDFVVWDDSSHRLQEAKHRIEDFLASELGLELKDFPFVQRTSVGMDFLGFRIYPRHIGLTRDSRKRYRNKCWALLNPNCAPRSEEELQVRLQSLNQFVQFAQCWHFRRNVIQRHREKVPWA